MEEIFLYLTTKGRKTGKAHQIEIWYVEHGGCFYLCSEKREDADWVRNIIQNPSVEFYLAPRGQAPQNQNGQASIVTDESLFATLSDLFEEKYRWNAGLFVQICATE